MKPSFPALGTGFEFSLVQWVTSFIANGPAEFLRENAVTGLNSLVPRRSLLAHYDLARNFVTSPNGIPHSVTSLHLAPCRNE